MANATEPRLSVDKRHYVSNGVAYSGILEHVVTYAGNYPTVTRNSKSTNAQAVRGSRPGSSTSLATGPTNRPPSVRLSKTPAAEFTTGLVNHISGMGTQTGSVSLAFVNNFLRQCFTPELELVDFPNALVALDHLADLESWRKKETNSALKRLSVSRKTLQSDIKYFTRDHPSIAAWIKEVEPSEKKVEAMYTQLYVGIRRWILINEFSLRPFNPHNCLAMLNTLFPPPNRGERGLNPTPALTPAVLHKQRETYVAYMSAVETRGTDVLCNLIEQNRRPGEETGWPAVRETLDKYLRVTSRLVDEARAIDDWSVLATTAADSKASKHQRGPSGSTKPRRKTTDSGVSFDEPSNSDRSSGGSMGNRDIRMAGGASQQSIPNAPQYQQKSYAQPTPPPAQKSRQPQQRQQTQGSTLEKIASSLRRFTTRQKNSSSRDKNANRDPYGQSEYERNSKNSSARATQPPPPSPHPAVLRNPPSAKQTPSKPISGASNLAPADAYNVSGSRGRTHAGDEDTRTGRPATSGADRKRERSRSAAPSALWGSKRAQAEPAERRSGKAKDGYESYPYDHDEAMRQRAISEAKRGRAGSVRR